MNDEKVHNPSAAGPYVPVKPVYKPSEHWQLWEKFRSEMYEKIRSRWHIHRMTEGEMQFYARGCAHELIEEAQASAARRASYSPPARTSAAYAPRHSSRSAPKFRFAATPAQRPAGRHSRKCAVCRHPYRDAIERDFLNWRSAERIAIDFAIPHHSAIYRHAHATGLFPRRIEFIGGVLDYILKRPDSFLIYGDTMVRAVRAYSRYIDDDGSVARTTTMIYSLSQRRRR